VIPVNLDENSRNADWIKVVGRAREFARWSGEAIDAECRAAYRSYHAEVRNRHIEYYAARSDQRSETHAFAASSRPFAVAPGWEYLSDALAERTWHVHHLSGGSSQVLAIVLLAAATKADPALSWLPGHETIGPEPLTLFEVELAEHVLNERPRQTSLDWLVLGSDGVAAAEAKFTETGFGVCSCRGKPECSVKVLERPYWRVASRELGFRKGMNGGCALSLAYQPIRNMAAAEAIAGRTRQPSFLLLYAARNPYFSGAGSWEGWVAALEGLIQYGAIGFKALSWQQLLGRVRMDPAVTRWAYEKHGISADG
jgi:hypothetical protein